MTAASRLSVATRVIGRQQHAARGEAGSLFQMQVGDDEQALLLPEQRAGESATNVTSAIVTFEVRIC